MIMNAHSPRKKLDEIIERLVTMTDQAFETEVKKYLDCMANFWNYSFANTILIATQFPNATRVAGIKTWNKLGRRVKKGEKGIAILVPVFVPKTEEEAEAEEEEAKDVEEADDEPDATKAMAIRFRTGYVFDISQTEGEPLPEVKWWSDGDAPEQLIERITEVIRQDGIVVGEAKSLAGARGISLGGKIAVLENATLLSKASTLIHEWAHEIRRRELEKMNRQVEEVIVDAVAYVVLSHFGLDPADNANYIALWQGDKNLLRQNLAVVKRLSTSIIEKIEETQDGSTRNTNPYDR